MLMDNGDKIRNMCIEDTTLDLPTGIRLHYVTYAIDCSGIRENTSGKDPEIVEVDDLQPIVLTKPDAARLESAERIIFIMGFAAPYSAWLPMIQELMNRKISSELSDAVLHICAFDNRGIGQSSSPAPKTSYTTTLMATDALQLMDHLGWPKAHVVGFSMGSMIASKLAGLAPERVKSLTLLGGSLGGRHAIPSSWRGIKNAVKGMRAKADTAREKVVTSFHFSKSLLKSKHPHKEGSTWHGVLIEEYLHDAKVNGRQTEAGGAGHLNAVLKHKLTRADRNKIHRGNFPIKVVHGNDDIMAAPARGADLARAVGAPLVLLPGGHLITRECAKEVNDELLEVLKAARARKLVPEHVHPQVDVSQSLCSCL